MLYWAIFTSGYIVGAILTFFIVRSRGDNDVIDTLENNGNKIYLSKISYHKPTDAWKVFTQLTEISTPTDK